MFCEPNTFQEIKSSDAEYNVSEEWTSLSCSDNMSIEKKEEPLNNAIHDQETEEEKEKQITNNLIGGIKYRNLVWTGVGKRCPVLVFSREALVTHDPEFEKLGKRYRLAYKMIKSETRILRTILTCHGFRETRATSDQFNLIWTGCHLKPYALKEMGEHQKVNHFPRSHELTRKDRLYKNVQNMQDLKGNKHFDFVPPSFVLPGDFDDFCASYKKEKGVYIVKPIASSRGRGIYLCSHPNQVPVKEHLIVSRYIDNPLLINGFKFDIRLYVCVTSFSPLVIYIYEEGLTRFATAKFQSGAQFIQRQFMHLTNYSVNKNSQDFVHNDDAQVEDYGSKWSLGALLRYLKSQGKDTSMLMMRIEDVVIKALLSVEPIVSGACRIFHTPRNLCFELFGFDIIVDQNMRPWLLEVNLCPSLGCDTPLDHKVKSCMLIDLLSLIGIPCRDPKTSSVTKKNNKSGPSQPSSPYQVHASPRPATAASPVEDARVIRRIKEEYQRRGGWLRIYPSKDSWHIYSSYIHPPSNQVSLLLHQTLFSQSWNVSPLLPPPLTNVAGISLIDLHSLPENEVSCAHLGVSDRARRILGVYTVSQERLRRYERQLECACGPEESCVFCQNDILPCLQTKSKHSENFEQTSNISSSGTPASNPDCSTHKSISSPDSRASEPLLKSSDTQIMPTDPSDYSPVSTDPEIKTHFAEFQSSSKCSGIFRKDFQSPLSILKNGNTNRAMRMCGKPPSGDDSSQTSPDVKSFPPLPRSGPKSRTSSSGSEIQPNWPYRPPSASMSTKALAFIHSDSRASSSNKSNYLDTTIGSDSRCSVTGTPFRNSLSCCSQSLDSFLEENSSKSVNKVSKVSFKGDTSKFYSRKTPINTEPPIKSEKPHTSRLINRSQNTTPMCTNQRTIEHNRSQNTTAMCTNPRTTSINHQCKTFVSQLGNRPTSWEVKSASCSAHQKCCQIESEGKSSRQSTPLLVTLCESLLSNDFLNRLVARCEAKRNKKAKKTQSCVPELPRPWSPPPKYRDYWKARLPATARKKAPNTSRLTAREKGHVTPRLTARNSDYCTSRRLGILTSRGTGGSTARQTPASGSLTARTRGKSCRVGASELAPINALKPSLPDPYPTKSKLRANISK